MNFFFFWIFFPPTWKKHLRRDPSSVEYSAGSLTLQNLFGFRLALAESAKLSRFDAASDSQEEARMMEAAMEASKRDMEEAEARASKLAKEIMSCSFDDDEYVL